jgi:hypothetical protein
MLPVHETKVIPMKMRTVSRKPLRLRELSEEWVFIREARTYVLSAISESRGTLADEACSRSCNPRCAQQAHAVR